VAADHGEQVVEVVGHAPGQAADRLHLLRLADLLLAAAEVVFRVVAGARVAHGDGHAVLEGHDLMVDPAGGRPRQRDLQLFFEGLVRAHHPHRALDERLQGREGPQIAETPGHDLVAPALQQAFRVAVDVLHHEVGHDAGAVADGGQDSHRIEAAFDGGPEARVAAAQGHLRTLARDGIAEAAGQQFGIDVALDDVVLRAALQRLLGHRPVVGRHHHDRHVRERLHHAVHGFEAGRVRQPEVEEDGFDSALAEPVERFREPLRPVDRPFLIRPAEHGVDHGRKIRLILHEEEPRRCNRKGMGGGHQAVSLTNGIRLTNINQPFLRRALRTPGKPQMGTGRTVSAARSGGGGPGGPHAPWR
jgi:hypothetical protein